MKRLRIHWIAILCSFCGALAGAIIMDEARWKPVDGGAILWSGLVFSVIFLLSYAGFYIGLRFFGRYKSIMPEDWSRWFFVALAGLFILGAAGQALYPQPETDKVYFTQEAPLDLVLLIDCSGSMDGARLKAAKDASSQLVDALNDEINLQVISFASIIVDSTEFKRMDSGGREYAKTFIRGIDCTGKTNFDYPLKAAAETLVSQGRSSCKKMVLLVTDGKASVSSNVANEYVSSNIGLHSVRITENGDSSADIADLIAIVRATGGTDVKIRATASGSIDASELLSGFRKALQKVIVEESAAQECTLIVPHKTTDAFFLRTLILGLCYLVSAIGFFGKIPRKELAIRSIIALFVGMVFVVTGKYWGFMAWYLITIGTALVVVSPVMEMKTDV